jgi:hypothetical protein
MQTHIRDPIIIRLAQVHLKLVDLDGEAVDRPALAQALTLPETQWNVPGMGSVSEELADTVTC